MTDSGIVSLSAANALAIRLDEKVKESAPPEKIPPEKKSLAHAYSDFACGLVIPTGRMAKALESLDHMEEFSFRRCLEEGVIDIIRAVSECSYRLNYDLVNGIHTRWKEIEAKSIF